MTNAITPTFSTTTRAHIGLVVGDLEASIAFYSALFEEQPTKQRSDYAKFEPEQPALNLSLSLSKSQDSTPSTARGHFGVQVKSQAEVAAASRRLVRAGLVTRSEEGVTCCHAVQDKVWVVDPDGNPWEVFVVLDERVPEGRMKASACCTGAGPSQQECC